MKKIKDIVFLLILTTTLSSVTLAEPQSKSWTQKAKEIVTNKKVITGAIISLAVVIGVTSGVFGYSSWSRQKKHEDIIRQYEMRHYGKVFTKMPTDAYKDFVEELVPQLEQLHVSPTAIKNFRDNLNPPFNPATISRNPTEHFSDYILNGVIRAKPTVLENKVEYYGKKLEVVEKLLNAGAYPEGSTASGFGSILTCAMSTQQNQIVKLLIDRGGLGTGTIDGYVSHAIETQNWEILSYLLQKSRKVHDWNSIFREVFKLSDKELILQELRKIPQIPQDQLDNFLNENPSLGL